MYDYFGFVKLLFLFAFENVYFTKSDVKVVLVSGFNL